MLGCSVLGCMRWELKLEVEVGGWGERILLGERFVCAEEGGCVKGMRHGHVLQSRYTGRV